MKLCAWGEGDASFHRSPAKFSGRIPKKGLTPSQNSYNWVIMSESGKSLVCDVVLGFLCPPALIGKLSLEAADIQAKERKEREEPVPEVDNFTTLVLVVGCVAGLIASVVWG